MYRIEHRVDDDDDDDNGGQYRIELCIESMLIDGQIETFRNPIQFG